MPAFLPLLLVLLAAPRPAFAEPTTTLIVARARAGSLVTDWIESDGNAHELKASLPVPIFGDGASVWIWRPIASDVQLCDCEGLARWRGAGLCPTRTEQGRAQGVQLIRLPEVLVAEAVPARALQPGEALAQIQGRTELLGVAGPYVFTQVLDELRSCLWDAPITEARFAVWDLSAQAPAVLFSRKELAALRGTEQVAAFAQIGAGSLVDAPKSLEFAAILPRFDEGGLALRYQFTAPVCASCGDGAWSTGTRSAVMEATALPEALQPVAPAPSALAVWRLAHPDAEPLGWTSLVGPPETLAPLLERLLSLVR